jgi:hypothetical protein
MQEDILRFYLDNPTHKDSLSLQSPMAYNTHNKYVLVAAKNKAISSIIDPSTNKVLASTAG